MMNKYFTGNKKQTGSTLLVIIAAMVLLAVLVGAVYTLNTTALFNQAVAQRASKALYLSESGIRITQSEYRAAVEADTAGNTFTVHSKLPSLHNKNFPLPDNAGAFTAYVYPYWFYAKVAYPAEAATITLYLPGELPRKDDTDTAVTIPASGCLRIKDSGRPSSASAWTSPNPPIAFYDNFNNNTDIAAFHAGNGGTALTFKLSTPFTDPLVADDEFYIGYATTTDATVSANNLIFYVTDANTAYMYPPAQGTIFTAINEIKNYKYDLRIIDSSLSPVKVTLTNIQDLAGNPASPEIRQGYIIFIGKSIGFRSTSTFGE
jgi:hypothetical protein